MKNSKLEGTKKKLMMNTYYLMFLQIIFDIRPNIPAEISFWKGRISGKSRYPAGYPTQP